MNKDLKKSIANTANRIRKAHGLPELSLAFWEEDLHPRGEHGRFATKASKGYRDSVRDVDTYHTPPGSRYGEFEGRAYDREQVQREMREIEYNSARLSQEKSNARKFFEGLGITIGGVAVSSYTGALASAAGYGFIAASGAGVLGVLLGTGIAVYGIAKMAKAVLKATAYVVGLYGTKTAIGVGRAVTEPFAEAGRGIYEGATT